MSELTGAGLKDLILRIGLESKVATVIRDVADSLQTSGTQELTVSGAVDLGTRAVELNHATVIVAATMAPPTNGGLVVIKDTSATGTAAHTITLTSGTFNGTNAIATLNALNECIAIFFDSAGNGTVLVNTGVVAFSG